MKVQAGLSKNQDRILKITEQRAGDVVQVVEQAQSLKFKH
jgi:hypothetical protein